MEVFLILILGSLGWVSINHPDWLVNHWPHILLPRDWADSFQRWVQRF